MLLLLLVVLSLLWNLGLPALYHEETRRTLIAQEMIFSGNYIVPTEMGEPYYEKPPVYNWLLVFSQNLFGSFSEFAVRVPTVVALLLMGLFHYLFVRKFLDRDIAFYSSLCLVTVGNFYFYFSLLAEIDVFYSLLVYLCIASIFYFSQRDSLPLMYLSSFALTAVGFLTKGFPSIVFLYLSLAVFFLSEKKAGRFLSPFHLLGLAVFALVVGAYLYLYSLQGSVERYIEVMWSESFKRTALGSTPATLLTHLWTFPLGTAKALFPYSLLLLFALRKGFLREVLSVPVVRFSVLVFASNYLVYWVSPGAKQRYIMAIFPFVMLVLCYAYLTLRHSGGPRDRALMYFSRTVLVALAATAFLLPFHPVGASVPLVWVVSLALGAASLSLLFFSVGAGRSALFYLVLTTVVARVAFVSVFLPIQASPEHLNRVKEDAETIAALAEGRALHAYGEDNPPHSLIFYIERHRGEILHRSPQADGVGYFLARDTQLEGLDITPVYRSKVDDSYVLFTFKGFREEIPP